MVPLLKTMAHGRTVPIPVGDHLSTYDWGQQHAGRGLVPVVAGGGVQVIGHNIVCPHRGETAAQSTMTQDLQPHRRRSIRLPGYDYAGPGAYFITIVMQGRACLFGTIEKGRMQLSEQGTLADKCWHLIPEHFHGVELGAYVVMPNHIQGILILHDRSDAAASERRGTIYRAPTTDDADTTGGFAIPTIERFQNPVVGSIPSIVRTYKAAVTRAIVREFDAVPRIWQRGYYEHVIRDDADHQRIHLYIESNIVNWASDQENLIK